LRVLKMSGGMGRSVMLSSVYTQLTGETSDPSHASPFLFSHGVFASSLLVLSRRASVNEKAQISRFAAKDLHVSHHTTQPYTPCDCVCTTDLRARKSPLGNGPTCWVEKASDLWKSVSEGSELWSSGAGKSHSSYFSCRMTPSCCETGCLSIADYLSDRNGTRVCECFEIVKVFLQRLYNGKCEDFHFLTSLAVLGF